MAKTQQEIDLEKEYITALALLSGMGIADRGEDNSTYLYFDNTKQRVIIPEKSMSDLQIAFAFKAICEAIGVNAKTPVSMYQSNPNNVKNICDHIFDCMKEQYSNVSLVDVSDAVELKDMIDGAKQSAEETDYMKAFNLATDKDVYELFEVARLNTETMVHLCEERGSNVQMSQKVKAIVNEKLSVLDRSLSEKRQKQMLEQLNGEPGNR